MGERMSGRAANECVVAASELGGVIRAVQQGVDLGGGQEAHHRPAAPFGWDGQHLADLIGILGFPQRGVLD